MKYKRCLAAALGFLVSQQAFSQTKDSQFPFQSQAIQFRLNQGFFKASGELFEEILKASGLVDKNKTIKITDPKTQKTSFLKYNRLKSQIRLFENQIQSQFMLDIAKSQFFLSEKGPECKVELQGPLQFTVLMNINARAATEVQVPEDKFIIDQLSVVASGCGFIMNGLIKTMLPGQLQSVLQSSLAQVANEEELKAISPTDLDSAFKKANIYLNTPSMGPLDLKRTKGQVDVDFGILGYMSNANSVTERLSISNPRRQFLNQLGLQWSFDAGMRAKSQNIFDPKFLAQRYKSSAELPEWGEHNYRTNGQVVDFDAGLRLRTSFLKNFFETMYQAGLFNIQIQDSLLSKEDKILDPTGWTQKLKMTLPNGELLNNENYADSRLELRVAAPPSLDVKNDKEFNLHVPQFYLALFVKAKNNPKEYEALKFKARFNLQTAVTMSESAKLGFNFKNRPLVNFEIISREGVGGDVSNKTIESEMNSSLVALLSQSQLEVPFLNGRKIEMKSLSIEGQSAQGQALSMYLKIK